MQIVIEIEEETYNLVKSWNYPTDTAHKMLFELVTNGTPLQKGHGRLIDESDLIPDSDYEDGMFYSVSIGAINGAPTIIEADKSEG